MSTEGPGVEEQQGIRRLSGRRVCPADARFAVVASRFNAFIVDRLVSGALDTLRAHGVADGHITLVQVPGAFELPLAARLMATGGGCHAVIALGVVIRGQTAHFDYVAGECAAGLARVAVETGVPVALGVLTTENTEQAIDRAGGKAGNKGAEAAETAIEMADLVRQLGSR